VYHGTRLIIRRLWPLKPTDKILFLFYYSRHKLEISLNNAQAKKFHVSRRKRPRSWRTDHRKRFL